jgi:PST family polysaccharide transporter
MFSALSKIQKESERVRRAYLKAMQILAFIIFPVMIGLFVVARPFVLSLFGQKWVGIVPLIQILTWVGIVQTLNHPTGWIYTSQNKTNWMFWWGIFGSGILVAAIVIGVWFGSVKSVAIAYTIANILITYPCIAIPGKLINMSFWDVIKVVYPAFINALIMALIVYAISIILPENLIIQLKLIIQVFIGILIYFGIAYFLNLEAFEEVKDIILKQLSNNN